MSKETMAQQLFNNGDVNQVDSNTFVCHGSNGNQYEIKRETNANYNYEFYCKCPAWKFDSSRRCKHVIAVQLFEQKNKQMKPTIQPSHTHTVRKVTKAKPKGKVHKVTKAEKKDCKSMEWTEPDGSKTILKFDEDGNLIGKEKKK